MQAMYCGINADTEVSPQLEFLGEPYTPGITETCVDSEDTL